MVAYPSFWPIADAGQSVRPSGFLQKQQGRKDRPSTPVGGLMAEMGDEGKGGLRFDAFLP